ncbi:unnamed protein product [Colletotrichum noveboracense]|uniref:Uncharacterized protein n=1 Tax=Colletotrichum noveboracense TaxID=2664923 RepID=A0A9W4RQ67_9PEZI|nr:unnamed protein product [Colletotrichum noveboracense]
MSTTVDKRSRPKYVPTSPIPPTPHDRYVALMAYTCVESEETSSSPRRIAITITSESPPQPKLIHPNRNHDAVLMDG